MLWVYMLEFGVIWPKLAEQIVAHGQACECAAYACVDKELQEILVVLDPHTGTDPGAVVVHP